MAGRLNLDGGTLKLDGGEANSRWGTRPLAFPLQSTAHPSIQLFFTLLTCLQQNLKTILTTKFGKILQTSTFITISRLVKSILQK